MPGVGVLPQPPPLPSAPRPCPLPPAPCPPPSTASTGLFAPGCNLTLGSVPVGFPCAAGPDPHSAFRLWFHQLSSGHRNAPACGAVGHGQGVPLAPVTGLSRTQVVGRTQDTQGRALQGTSEPTGGEQWKACPRQRWAEVCMGLTVTGTPVRPRSHWAVADTLLSIPPAWRVLSRQHPSTAGPHGFQEKFQPAVSRGQ